VLTPTIVLLLILLLPGLVALAKSRGTLPTSSAISLGFVSVFAYFGFFVGVNRYIDIPFTVLTASLGYVALLIMIWLWVPQGSSLPRQPLSHTFIAASALIAAGVFHLFIWNHSLKSWAVLPNHDVYIHTNWVGNMARYKSLSSIAAYTHPISGPGTAAPLYPFSMHALCAYVVQLGSGTASVVVIAITRLCVVLFWPLGIFSLARSIGLRTYIGASAAAATTVALYNFPYSTLGWGGVGMVIGIIVLVHSVAISIDWLPKQPKQLLVIFGVAMFALLMTHTSEAFILPIMVLVLGWPKIQLSNKSRQITAILAVLSFVLFVYPWLDKWFGNGYISSLAAAGNGAGAGTVYQGLGLIINLSTGMEYHSLWVPGILAAGILGITYLRHFRNVLFFYGIVFLGAFITSRVDIKPWSEISIGFTPWYRQFQRMVYLIVPVVAIMGGIAIEALASYRDTRVVKRVEHTARCVISIGLIVCMLIFSWPKTAYVFKVLEDAYAPLSRKDLTAPTQVPELLDQRTNILASFDSGIGYWSADYNVRTFSAPQLLDDFAWKRETLFDSINQIGVSDKARNLVDELDITHIVTNTRSMSGPPRPDINAIKFSNNFESLWTGDSITIWEIKPVIFGFAGKLSEPFNPSIDSIARWALEDSLRIGIHNRTQQMQQVSLSFAVSQNICNSGRSVTVNDSQYLFKRNKTAIWINLDFKLQPKEGLKEILSIAADQCIDKATGMDTHVAISHLSSTIKTFP